ncbi:DUF2461 family protein, partial [Actinoplanes sp. NPDC051633]|uniref:DUF2461 family protein n=1 Tax=Actinoplanes sp. NPDC051633 TaxID=3155670 RepID=UPI00341261D5
HVGACLLGRGYIHRSAAGLAAGWGMNQRGRAQLARYRRAVADDRTGRELTTVIGAIERSRVAVIGHGSLKTAPRGYPKDHPRGDLLRHKGLTTWQEWEPAAWLGTATAKKRIVDFLRTSRPLRQWLDDNVGPE